MIQLLLKVIGKHGHIKYLFLQIFNLFLHFLDFASTSLLLCFIIVHLNLKQIKLLIWL